MAGRVKMSERTRSALRLVVGAVTVVGACWLPVGTAYADETNTGSHTDPASR